MKFSVNDLKERFSKDKVGDWVVKYKRQVAVGCLAGCLVIFAGVSLAGSSAAGGGEAEPVVSEDAEEQQGTVVSEAVALEEQAMNEINVLEKDAYPEVNELVQNYYNYMAEGDMEGLATVEDVTNEEEQNRILRSKDLVEGYQNISCYTKKGLEEGSYLVFVYYELKFAEIDTPAPGISLIYVYTNDEGNLVIFNGEASDELNAYAEERAQDEDVLALRAEVSAKYEEAKAADEKLVTLEERYRRIAEGGDETEETAEAAEEQPAEETTETAEQPAEETTEEQPAEETAETTEEQPAETTEETAEEQPAEGSTATAQNRETRFTESVRLRAEPSTEAEYLGTAYQGESVTQIESYEDGWSKINYNGTECYCMTQYLE
ncbi:MAG TPA: SH3 domain-containing protein [Candidatus Merdisoma merdipullorum]|nr:SH3 domain-containing protein [Candidatus Merdisoma merdipullorum]